MSQTQREQIGEQDEERGHSYYDDLENLEREDVAELQPNFAKNRLALIKVIRKRDPEDPYRGEVSIRNKKPGQILEEIDDILTEEFETIREQHYEEKAKPFLEEINGGEGQ